MDSRQQIENDDASTAAARSLRRQGALEFIARVSDAAIRRHIANHDADPVALTAEAFHDEAVAVLINDIPPNRHGTRRHTGKHAGAECPQLIAATTARSKKNRRD